MLNSFLAGKIFQYYLNAYSDAKVSFEIIDYIKGRKKVSNRTIFTSKKLKSLVNKPTNDHFISAAYTMFYWNGYYDYLWAKALENIIIGKKLLKQVENHVDDYEISLNLPHSYNDLDIDRSFFNPIGKLLNGQFSHLNSFSRSHKFDLSNINNKVIAESAKSIQLLNIIHNNELADKLEKRVKSNDEKVKAVYKLAKIVPNEIFFIKGCISSLKGASFWDRLFIFLLNFRF